MQATVWKQKLPAQPGVFEIEVPSGAVLLSAREQYFSVVVYFQCDPAAAKTRRAVALVATGSAAPTSEEARFLGTAMFDGGRYVLHVFERII